MNTIEGSIASLKYVVTLFTDAKNKINYVTLVYILWLFFSLVNYTSLPEPLLWLVTYLVTNYAFVPRFQITLFHLLLKIS